MFGLKAAAVPMVRGQLWELGDLRGRSADRLACQQPAPNLSDSSNEQFIAEETVRHVYFALIIGFSTHESSYSYNSKSTKPNVILLTPV